MGTLYVHLLSVCVVLSSVVADDFQSHILIAPQSPVVEIGKDFTATCMLQNTSVATADDLYWSFSSGGPLPRQQYTRVSSTALNVTLTITGDTPKWLLCKCQSSSPYVMMNKAKFVSGILFRKGYPPEKPRDLSCVAGQVGDKISNVLNCTWEPGTRGSGELHTNYTLYAHITPNDVVEPLSVVVKQNSSGQITLPDIFPHHMGLDVWVTAANDLGTETSERLSANANQFVKTNPPSNVTVISEDTFKTSLLISWRAPITKAYVTLIYHIRFCTAGSGTWSEVPSEDTASYIQSFRLQNLTSDTGYIVQLRCRHDKEDNVYWSDWSANATARTPEDVPATKPDLWRNITQTDGKIKARTVQFICKDPRLSNGRIRSFSFNVSAQPDQWQSVNRSGSITDLEQITLPDGERAFIKVAARNSMGLSRVATLVIPKTGTERPPVRELQCVSRDGRLVVDWQPPSVPGRGCPVVEYVVEWAWLGAGGAAWLMDWQRERAGDTSTAIRGTLEKFTHYTVSVYPMYQCKFQAGQEAGRPAHVAVYLEEGAPEACPSVKVEPGKDEARVVWTEVPLPKRRGFITNYTIVYLEEDAKDFSPVHVSPDTFSYTLAPLRSSTKYSVRVQASTAAGSCSGTPLAFTTPKYAPGEIEGIVVGVCFGFLFLVMLAMFLCVYKRDSLKKNFWPQIPDPGNSSIGVWSPDSPSQADAPQESAMADVSVVEVDALDGRSVFEEDKAGGLPLKKDKYLSEEHSSGIGGSSCMSSPRQSVSDSDEGDSGQTTGSTVQYSSVVAAAPGGYKGQTPGPLPNTAPAAAPQQHVFARSESTQPLLEEEQHPHEDGRAPHRHPAACRAYFGRASGGTEGDGTELRRMASEEESEGPAGLRFCPLEEDSRQATPPTEEAGSSYRPQLNGYRPQ